MVETVDHEEDDWHRFLDLVEEVGGSTIATELFSEFVTDVDLSERSAARKSYVGLRSSGWDIPFYVREPMEDWEFASAETRIDEAEKVLDTASDISENAEALGTEPPSSLEDAYESATGSLDTVDLIARAQLETSEHLLDARVKVDDEPALLEQIGLYGEEPAEQLDEAVNAFSAGEMIVANAGASEVVATIHGAQEQGLVRLSALVAVLVVLGAIVGGVLHQRRSARKRLVPATQGEPRVE